MSMWRKTLVYLGLVEEPEEHAERGDRTPPHVADTARPGRDPGAPEDTDAGTVRRLQRVPDPASGHVRAMSGSGLGGRVQIVAVGDFDQGAEEIGRQYRMGSPVLFDMADVDTPTARRVLDFVAGVTYALQGRMTRVGRRAFLIVPDGLEISSAERERLAALGYGGATV